ncbi:MAG TPA: MerR family transcriptional regulator [Bacillota bacterium]|nr:MerR family transcriptional regulator [Bacillota bacterium]
MEYTVQKLAMLSGISARALRYYDEIGLLKPASVNAAGYRIYGEVEVDRLQQIMFYRELGVNLEKIGEIMTSPSFDQAGALKDHRVKLLAKRDQLDLLIANLEKTIATMEGRMEMTDQEKFEGFKQKLINENEAKYGTEIRVKYGEEAVWKSNQKFKGLTHEQYAEFTKLETEVMDALKAAFVTGDPTGEPAQKAVELHRKWLSFTWDRYSKEAHAGLAQMYVDDPRFTAYYDREQPGMAVFLRDAVLVYTGMNR